MTSRDWFGVGVRLIGAWQLIEAVSFMLGFLELRLELSPSRGSSGLGGSAGTYFLYAAGHLLIALYFLLGTEDLIRRCFGEPERVPTDTQTAPELEQKPPADAPSPQNSTDL